MEFAEQKATTRSRPARSILLGSVVVVLLLVLQLLVPARPDLWWQVFFEAMHAPLFGIIAVCLLAMTPQAWRWQVRLILALTATLLLAVLSELAQAPLPNRSASFSDLVNDMLGALAFLSVAVVLSPNFHVPQGRGRWLILFAIALLVWPFKPLADVSAAYWERYDQLPSLAPVGNQNTSLFYILDNAQVETVASDQPARVASEFRFGTTGSSRIHLHDPWSDWRSYRSLIIDLENLGDRTLDLTLRIHDEAHLNGDQPHNDRFNRRLKISPGRRPIQIDLADIETAPLDRNMDMAHIDGVILFSTRDSAGGHFIIHDLRLD